MIEIIEAGPGTWPSVERALTGGGDGATCWCQWFLLTNSEFHQLSRDELRARLRTEVEDGARPPGLLALVDGEPAGWCRVSARADQPKLTRSQVVRAAGTRPLDAPGVWAVTCFVVRREFRGSGVATRLLDAAVAFARGQGATVVEGYPIDLAARPRTSSNELFHGSSSMFARAGFEETGRASASRVVMARRVEEERRGTGPGALA